MRILTLSTLFPNAVQPNLGIFVERQATALAKRDGMNVKVINPIALPPWPLSCHSSYAGLQRLPEAQDWRGLSVHRPRFTLLPMIGGRFSPTAIVRAVLPLAQRLHAKTPFDLIDAEFLYPDGPAAMHIARALGLPFTIKARGADVHHWGEHPAYCKQIVGASYAASGLLAVSEALKADMVSLGMPQDNIRVHYTGCDQGRFRPLSDTGPRETLGVKGPLLVSVGALIARKRQDLAIRALAELPDATLLVIGDGPEKSSYRALAAALGVGKRVRFVGAIPHDELPRYLAAADALVLVSASEGLANSWVEALACGTPVVIGDVGGARELVRDDVAGRIIEPDPTAIAEAVRAILAAPPSREAVRATVARFTWQRNAEELESFFAEILNN